MIVFNLYCIDNQTKNQLVLSGATYNNACYWLEKKLKEINAKITNTKELKTNLTLIETNKNINFIYDENRSLLLKMEE